MAMDEKNIPLTICYDQVREKVIFVSALYPKSLSRARCVRGLSKPGKARYFYTPRQSPARVAIKSKKDSQGRHDATNA